MKIILSESENYDHDKFLLEGVGMESWPIQAGKQELIRIWL